MNAQDRAEFVSLREYVEALIVHERELREAAAKEAQRALALQASEYERRLDGLNHEHDRTAALLSKIVGRDRFDEYVAEHAKYAAEQMAAIDKRFGRIERTIALAAGGLIVLLVLFKFIPIGFGLGVP
jgi:hypothetical protein